MNLDAGVVRAMGKGSKERLVPLGEAAEWISKHVKSRSRKSDTLFLTNRGAGMTRQAFWHLIRRYGARHSRQEALAARAAPRVRHAPHQPRRRPARGAASARPRRHLHHADLHARGPRALKALHAKHHPADDAGPGIPEAQKVAFSEHTYEYVEHGGTEVPAQALGVPSAIVKTLVMEDEARKPLIVLMHGDRKVSTKNLAPGRAQVDRACKPEVAQRHTGYQWAAPRRSAPKPLPVYVERSILELPEIYINGGRRGLLVKLRSADLARVLSVSPVDVALS